MTSPGKFHECLRVLELEPTADQADYPRAYRRMMMIWHPDRFPANSELWLEAREKTQVINDAYAFLLRHPRPDTPPAPGPGPRPDPESSPRPNPAPEPSPRPSPESSPRPAPAPERPQPGPKPSARPQVGPQPSRRPSGPFLGWMAAALVALAVIAVLAHPPLRLAPRPEPEAPSPASPEPRSAAPAQAEPAMPPATSLAVDQTAVIVLLPTQEEIDAAPAAQAAAMAHFQESALRVRAEIQRVHPNLAVQMTAAEEITVRGSLFRRKETCGYGYILSFPPHKPLIREGLQTTEGMLEFISSNSKE